MTAEAAPRRQPDADPAGSTMLPRLDAITGLRWWAAFAVFVFHFRNLVPLPLPLATLAQFGYLGVTFFFVLSGFVLTWSWRPTVDKRTFWWRRFARIWPLSVVTLLIALPVFYSFAPDPALPWVRPFDLGVLLLCLLLLQGWWRDPAILLAGNPAAWTLTVEVFFYATHPFVMLVLRRLTRVGALLAAAGVILFAFGTRVGVIADAGGVLAAMPPPIQHLNEFVLGMCVAWAFRRGWVPRIPLLVPLVLLVGWFGTLTVTKLSTTGRPVYDLLILSPSRSRPCCARCSSSASPPSSCAVARGSCAHDRSWPWGSGRTRSISCTRRSSTPSSTSSGSPRGCGLRSDGERRSSRCRSLRRGLCTSASSDRSRSACARGRIADAPRGPDQPPARAWSTLMTRSAAWPSP